MNATTSDPLASHRRAARSLATRDSLLLAATQVIGQEGYDGSSVVEIALAAGLSKNHIFQHFGSKELLAAGALERAVLTWRGDVAQAAQIFPQPERQLAHAAQTLSTLHGRGWAGLRLIGALVQSRKHLPESLTTAIEKALEEMHGFFRDAIKIARKNGQLDSEIKPRQLGAHCIHALLGAALSDGDPGETMSILRTLLFDLPS
jgi:AcrR family transcriptional regulator